MPPTAALEKPAVKTPEQLAADAESAAIAATPAEVVEEFISGVVAKPTPKQDKPAAPEPAKPEKPAAAKPVPQKKPAAKPAREPAPAPALNAEELATAVGKGVAEGLAARAPVKPEPESDALAGLSEEDRDQIPVFEKMEAMYPARYPGLKQKFIENTKAVNEYRSKWESENPGKEFNEEDHDHDDFFAKHALDWREGDETNARAKMIADAEVAEFQKKTNGELEELRSRERAREQAPAILTESRSADRKVWDAIGGDFSKIIKADGTIDDAMVKKLEAEDPIASEIAFSQVANLNAHFQELIKLDRGLVKLDKANLMHGFIVKFAVAQENAILALPKDKQVDATGKKYVKSVDFQAMTPQQRTKHWTLGAAELNRLMAAEYGVGIKRQIETERARIERINTQLGYVKGDKAKPAAAAPGAAEPEEPSPEPEEEVESPENTPVATGRPGEAPPGGPAKDANGGFFKSGW